MNPRASRPVPLWARLCLYTGTALTLTSVVALVAVLLLSG